ncbi:uncharacterized protein LOC100679860 [Nasonia vitripennis]|uniref:Uncharacterized protein n=1 Tax=Nasonia vitripennis TaxID=7425 RepID=A0A7M7TAC0_NASVI|nr:uncharacterized protein LOC100679860 [Nasonia vitripennis]
MRQDTFPAASAAANRATGPSSIIIPSSSSGKIIQRRRDDGDAAALRRSVTALDGGSPRSVGAHSTAFQRSPQPRRRSRPILFVLYLLALLLVAGAAETPKQQQQQQKKQAPRHPYNEYTWELNQINPWLSACDLAGPAPADLQGSCGPPEVPKSCPGPCPSGPELFERVLAMLERLGNATVIQRPRRSVTATESSSSKSDKRTRRTTAAAAAAAAPEQCLFYLEESHKKEVCREDFGRASSRSYPTPRENRYWFMSGLRLRHCCEHAAVNALAPGPNGPFEAVLNGGDPCVKALDKLLLVDALAARLHCEFEEVLARYDCGQTYSVIHNCTHCKEAYRKWVCSSLVPYFAHGGPLDFESSEESWTGRRIRPCRSLCQSVEQRCPYLLPGDRAPAYPTQYAGEPTFLCRDPNIPETGEQAARALHPNTADECCFNVCSEDEPAQGICANCTGSVPYMGPKNPDPPTAPQCDITSLPGPQQPARSPSSLCGSGGIGSMINPDDDDAEQSATSLSPDPSAEPSSPITATATATTTTTTTTTSNTATTTTTTTTTTATTTTTTISTSSAATTTSSPVPLLCLFWLWGVLFSSQCSVRCLLEFVGLAERCLRAFRVTGARLILLLLLAPLPALSRRQPQGRRLRRPHRRGARGWRCLAASPLQLVRSSVATTVSSARGATVAKPSPCRGRRLRCYCCCCCYRWWLWPSRWKGAEWPPYRRRGRGPRVGARRGRCCGWCYWRWLWPCRWKPKGRGPLTRLLAFRGQQQPLWPRKKRRRKVRFGASCCRELDLARSTSWCREPS